MTTEVTIVTIGRIKSRAFSCAVPQVQTWLSCVLIHSLFLHIAGRTGGRFYFSFILLFFKKLLSYKDKDNGSSVQRV